MMEISDLLESLGVPRPSETAVLPPDSTAEIVADAVQRFLAGDKNPEDAMDLLRELEMAGHRVTAAYGGRMITPGPPVKIRVKQAVQHWDQVTGLTTPQMIEIDQTCPHTRIQVDGQMMFVSCEACGSLLNAVWWIARHTDSIVKSERWRDSVEQSRRGLVTEIERLKNERSKLRSQVKAAKITGAKQALRADGSDYLIPPAKKRTTTTRKKKS